MNPSKFFSSLLLVLGPQISTLYAQNNLGFYAGPTAGRFMSFPPHNELYKSEYRIESGAMLGVDYEMQIDTIVYMRCGIQYQYQLADLETSYYGGHAYSSYNNLDYRFQQLRLLVGYGIKVTPEKKIDTRILFGLWGSYNFRAHIKGNAWHYENKTATLPSGQEVTYQVVKEEAFDGFDNKSIMPFGFGANLGWSLAVPLNGKTALLFHNEYFMNFTPVPVFRDAEYTSLLSGVFGVGITYKLK